MKSNKVPFSEIKPGEFFRIKGKTLYQRCRGIWAQVVTGEDIGAIRSDIPATVTPVNASIVEEK